MAEEVDGIPFEEFIRMMQIDGLRELTRDKRKSVVIDLTHFNRVMDEVVKIVPKVEDKLPGRSSVASFACDYQLLCCDLLHLLNIDSCYFDSKFDMCFCAVCHQEREDDEYYYRGEPPCLYGVPIGWCRFGLRTPPRTIKLKAFPQWHRAYHGTTIEAVSGILDSGNLVIPGDYAIDGKRISQPEGHFTADDKPAGFDEKKVFLSPSIHYAGHPTYAHTYRWERSHNEVYCVQVALQVLVKPACYVKGKETLLREEDRTVFDQQFPNSEIEWSTKEYGSTIPYGLVVRIVDWVADDDDN